MTWEVFSFNLGDNLGNAVSGPKISQKIIIQIILLVGESPRVENVTSQVTEFHMSSSPWAGSQVSMSQQYK